MRPQILFPLFASTRDLQGIGPRLEQLLARVAGPRVVDLLWHAPAGLIDRRHRPTIAEAVPGTVATIAVTIEIHYPGRGPRQPYRIHATDKTGALSLVFFHGEEKYLKAQFPIGETRLVSGRLELFNDRLQMTHPDYVASPQDEAKIPALEPVYPSTEGLSPKVMLKAMEGALARLPDLPEWQDAAFIARRRWPRWAEAIRTLHHPQSPGEIGTETPARERLAYDELLANQLALALVRKRQRSLKGRALTGNGKRIAAALKAFPFTLTAGQKTALGEIEADLAAPRRMVRLLQGDVGSGKTVVAALALIRAVEAGTQGALMAPTEILARQHAASCAPLFEAARVRHAILTGREKGRTRAGVLEALAAGDLDVLIGTHAVFSEDVAFRDLGLTVIDEQHRFGVGQRLALAAKAEKPVHLLAMTATPIPRSLALTAYGDMDVSRLTEKPAGRKAVTTRAIPLDRLDEVIDGLRRELKTGARAFWVCPLVEASEDVDWAAAEERFTELQQVFGEAVGLVHGRLKPAEKDAVMAQFKRGERQILVSTTVIEVGVDVPEATVMVIDHAERFGLAQLHQLRGRVGRGDRGGACLLLYSRPLSETAKARLDILRHTDDGFVIAEEDLRLRGAGDVLGTRQSGLPEFRFADLARHGELLQIARDDMRLILERDPELTSDRGTALRTLLYLFDRDEAVRTLRSG
ncbi:MAG: ATP-dependent DNA helicase RecG [Alphaproteobacteria bacterium]|nr:ATP-dependent DNA helicase RecG [Alphaproteobacteria bacterium]